MESLPRSNKKKFTCGLASSNCQYQKNARRKSDFSQKNPIYYYSYLYNAITYLRKFFTNMLKSTVSVFDRLVYCSQIGLLQWVRCVFKQVTLTFTNVQKACTNRHAHNLTLLTLLYHFAWHSKLQFLWPAFNYANSFVQTKVYRNNSLFLRFLFVCGVFIVHFRIYRNVLNKC